MEQVVAFKEWQVVCDALARGRQTILLRKGGIHEGRTGFSFAHDSFLLFPTRFHVQPGQVREGEIVALPEWRPGDIVRITHHVRVRLAMTLTDWGRVAALDPHHIYAADTVRERFEWQGRGMPGNSIHVAVVEARELPVVWEFPYDSSHGGCRSWVEVPAPPPAWIAEARPVLGPQELAKAEAALAGCD